MSRRFGTIRKRKSGRFQAMYEHNQTGGRQVARSFDTRRQAEDWLAEERTRLRRGEWLDPTAGRITLDDFFETWITGRSLAPRTVDLYLWLWRHCISGRLGLVRLAELTPMLVRSWHASLVRAERPGPTTTAKAYRLLSAVMSDAVRDGIIARHPCTIVGAGVEPRREIRVLTVPEIERLADAMPDRFRCLVLVASYGGLRWGELAGLRPSDVGPSGLTVTVAQTLSERQSGALLVGPPKTSAGYRTVALPCSVASEMVDHLGCFSSEEFVFTTTTGRPLRRPNFTATWKRSTELAGVSPLRFHDLRHTAATLATRHGATLREVQSRLGHASPAAALRYQHVVTGAEDRLVTALDDERRKP